MSPFRWLATLPKTVARRSLSTAILAMAALLPVLPGCTTSQPLLPAPTAAWETHMGQLHYRGLGERSVIGEVIVRRSGTRDFALSFLSGPGFPLLKLQVSGDDVVAEGLFARGRWRGKAANAPKQLKSWIALREVFAELPSRRTSYKRFGWSTEARFVGRRPEHIETNFSTGEYFAFHFAS